MSALVEFLLARIAEDEAVLNDAAARYSPTPGTELGIFLGDWGDDERWIVDYPPGRALAECVAKRRIVELHDDQTGGGWSAATDQVLRLLALPYADHPDFREEWRA